MMNAIDKYTAYIVHYTSLHSVADQYWCMIVQQRNKPATTMRCSEGDRETTLGMKCLIQWRKEKMLKREKKNETEKVKLNL